METVDGETRIPRQIRRQGEFIFVGVIPGSVLVKNVLAERTNGLFADGLFVTLLERFFEGLFILVLMSFPFMQGQAKRDERLAFVVNVGV